MNERGRGTVSTWNVASFIAAYTVVYVVGGVLIDYYRAPMWAGVALLACAVASMMWIAVRDGAPNRPPRPLRKIFLGSPGGWKDQTAREKAMWVWSWGNYPFFFAFTGMMLAMEVFNVRYGFAWASGILVVSLLLPAVCLMAWERLRWRRRPAPLEPISPGPQ